MKKYVLFVFVLSSFFLMYSSCNQDSIENETVLDLDDYPSIEIGKQVWMIYNLNTCVFSNGDSIPEARTLDEWLEAYENRKPAWCNYNNIVVNSEKYGKLYNWFAVADPRGLAPKGWTIPRDEDWIELTDYLGGQVTSGQLLKSKDFSKLEECPPGSNETGFSGLPGGRRQVDATFSFLGEYGYWWTISELDDDYAWSRYLFGCSNNIFRFNNLKGEGLSVRCLKLKN